MSGRGKLDFGYHLEFHSVPLKDKAADCIYLDENRICNNKKSDLHTAKCFRASWCPYREKAARVDDELEEVQEEKTDPEPQKWPVNKKRVVNPQCSVGQHVVHAKFGEGKILRIKDYGNKIDVIFSIGEKTFISDPDDENNAFKKGFLKLL